MDLRHCQKKGTKGFTLVELLVVISILALLGALLLPGLSRTKDKARRAPCLNNLRQINSAVRLYTDDNKDVLPLYGSNRPPEAFTYYATVITSYLGASENSSEHPKILACPADTFFYSFETVSRGQRIAQSAHDHPQTYFSSYGFNARNFPYGPNQVPQWPGIAGLKSTLIKDPSKTVLIEEYGALAPYSWHEPAAAPGHYSDAKCVLSFVDGHAGYSKMYGDAANAHGAHLEAWQYDPPLNYDYRWSADK